MIGASMGFSQKTMEIEEDTTIYNLLDMLNLPVDSSWVLVAVNNSVSSKDTKINENDEILIYPLGGGG
jgi:sulfur carrier protein ThiS